MRPSARPTFRSARLAPLFVAAALLSLACDDPKPTARPARSADFATATPAPDAVELLFLYGSEKKDWIADVTADFNRAGHRLADGKAITVKAVPMGSGESIDEVLTGRTDHLVSPASAAFVTIGNARHRATANADLVGPTEDLVLSPVVIAMWRPMAQALGWPDKPVGWADILDLAKNPSGWAAHGHPEWGRFRFGHTHPEFSNSGLISVLAEIYAASGKQRGLTPEDLARPEVGRFVSDIEKAVVHYGSSTGFFADRMFEGGPGYLSAAVLYESSVIDSYNRATPTEFPVVALYPKEGSFWSDHPVGVVQRDWVTTAHQQAAKAYIAFLRGTPQQAKALRYGFRPADTNIPLAAPIDRAHGVDPDGMKSVLEVPGPAVIAGALDLWKKNKKHANVVLVFDTSGSMNQENRMPSARAGGLELLNMLGDDDMISLLPFSTNVRWAGKNLPLRTARPAAASTINSLIANGDTSLYDAIADAVKHHADNPTPDRIASVVVLTDGDDTTSKTPLLTLLDRIKADGERQSVRVFTIGYGKGANKDILKRIADQTRARFYEGTPQNIRDVFKDIATFF